VIFSSVYLLVRSLLACVMVLARREVSAGSQNRVWRPHLRLRVRAAQVMCQRANGVDPEPDHARVSAGT